METLKEKLARVLKENFDAQELDRLYDDFTDRDFFLVLESLDKEELD